MIQVLLNMTQVLLLMAKLKLEDLGVQTSPIFYSKDMNGESPPQSMSSCLARLYSSII